MYNCYQFKTTHKGGVCLSSLDDALAGLIARYGKDLIYVKLRGVVIYEQVD